MLVIPLLIHAEPSSPTWWTFAHLEKVLGTETENTTTRGQLWNLAQATAVEIRRVYGSKLSEELQSYRDFAPSTVTDWDRPVTQDEVSRVHNHFLEFLRRVSPDLSATAPRAPQTEPISLRSLKSAFAFQFPADFDPTSLLNYPAAGTLPLPDPRQSPALPKRIGSSSHAHGPENPPVRPNHKPGVTAYIGSWTNGGDGFDAVTLALRADGTGYYGSAVVSNPLRWSFIDQHVRIRLLLPNTAVPDIFARHDPETRELFAQNGKKPLIRLTRTSTEEPSVELEKTWIAEIQYALLQELALAEGISPLHRTIIEPDLDVVKTRLASWIADFHTMGTSSFDVLGVNDGPWFKILALGEGSYHISFPILIRSRTNGLPMTHLIKEPLVDSNTGLTLRVDLSESDLIALKDMAKSLNASLKISDQAFNSVKQIEYFERSASCELSFDEGNASAKASLATMLTRVFSAGAKGPFRITESRPVGANLP